MALSYEKRHLSFISSPHQRTTAGDNLVGVVRNLTVNTSQVDSVGAGLTTLHTFPLPANSLRNNGDYLIVCYGGNFAANDNDKIVNASFGGTAYVTGGPVDIDGAIGWQILAKIVRLTSTSVRTIHAFSANTLFADSANVVNTFASSGLIFTRNNDVIGLPNLNSNAITMAVQGQGAVNGDVFQNLSIIEIVQN